MKRKGRTNIYFWRIALASVLMALTACEKLGPQINKTALLLPQPKPSADAAKPEPSAHFEAKNWMTEPEIHKARTGVIGKGPAPEATPGEGGFVLNFDEADLGEVAKVILGESLKKNYVISPKVGGKVTLRTVRPLSEKELLPTLEMLLRMNDAVLVEDKDGYRIEPSAGGAGHGSLGGAGFRLQVIPLKYIGADEMQTVIKPLLPENAIFKIDHLRNLLFLAGTSEDIERVVEVVQVFDVNFMKGMSFGLYPMKSVAVNTIFGEIQAMFGSESGSPLAGAIRLLPIERLNAIMVITPQAAYLDEVHAWIERLDRSNSAGGGNMHVYRAQHVDAVQLASTLSQVLSAGIGTSGISSGVAPGLRAAAVTGAAAGAAKGAGLLGGGTAPSGATGGGIGAAGGGLGAAGGGLGAAGGGLGAIGGGLGGASSENAIKVIPDPVNNALIISAPPFEYQAIEKLLKEVDVMPLQVLIDAMIVEVTLNDDLTYGLSWYFQHGGPAEDGTLTKLLDYSTLAAGPTGLGYSMVARNMKMTLTALASKNKIRVLSTPSLMVLNNQQANIKVGTQVPIRTSESTPTTSGTGTGNLISTSTIQMRDTGVQLTIRPRVNQSGLVTLEIQQSVDEVSDQAKGSNIDSPAILQRQINSSVAVADDDTVVLGGLIKETGSDGSSGLPLLNSVPWIGPLFSKVTRSANRTELVVLITPHVVKNTDKLRLVTEEYKSRLKGLSMPIEESR